MDSELSGIVGCISGLLFGAVCMYLYVISLGGTHW